MMNTQEIQTGGNEGKEQKQPVLADEIWFREDEKESLRQKSITASIRAGDRTAVTLDDKGGYKEGRFVSARIQKEDGAFDDWQTDIAVAAAKKIRLGDMTLEDLEGTSLAGKSKAELLKQLEKFYGKEFADDDIITVVRFEDKENIKNANDLIRIKTLSAAKQPKDNPENLNFSHYTTPLIEHDYPAKTPVMWNAAYREFGIDDGNVMLVGDPKQSKPIFDILRQDARYLGGGAGVGFKDEIVPYLDELDMLAKEIGAVNFIIKTPEGKLKGYNTDGRGYAESLEDTFRKRGEEMRGKKVVVLGAGGSGNAIAFALAERGMKVVILNRTTEKAKNLAEKINAYFHLEDIDSARFGGEDKTQEELADADAVVNVSTKGSSGSLERYSALAPARLPETDENVAENLRQAAEILKHLPRNAVVSDIVLGKELTPMMKSAKLSGFETLDGIPMVINQAVEAYWLLYKKELAQKGITKEKVKEIMRAAAEKE